MDSGNLSCATTSSDAPAGQVAGKLPAAVLWDLDGTLIDSDPYWVRAERSLLESCGGVWDDALAEQMQGAALPVVCALLRERGVDMTDERMSRIMTDDVMRMERAHLPWAEGVRDLLAELAAASVPSVLATGSPRPLVDNVLAHAPAGAFVASISGDDDVPHKPDPRAYLTAARLAGVIGDSDAGLAAGSDVVRAAMRRCVVFEDSLPGLTAAHASGAYVVRVTGYARNDIADAGLFDRSITDYRGLRPVDLLP
ncbi:HAD family hydrolase [Bifidobacterium leontopitheci]|uniref:Haloacid dehalogenase n=1 Tax=Bifidobacterium leontopitheci TaxID=2650774 RepID=A0A6I1GFC8_9BIFI|nr:HAD family phosphatase [Bifidobacterium leontopitheci]KAB7790353.1 haloacid dehalogenase [Bifidobacterium leontopitheci]